jgi:hypothetical protein
MIGRRFVLGLCLLCASLLCAFTAQSASANGTTAFTCVSNGGNKDFSDAHCDNEVTAGTGAFGHVLIPAEATTVQLTNDKTKNATTEHTPFVLKGELVLAPVKVTCTHANGEAKIKNEEVGGEMVVKGENGGVVNFTNCAVNEPLNCTVKEPIAWGVRSITKTALGTGGKEMGVEFKPPEGSTTFASVSFEGTSCSLKGKTFKVEGTMIATGRRGSTEAVNSSGATLEFTNAMTGSTLKFGGKPAELEGTLTGSRTTESKQTENAITATTTQTTSTAKGTTAFTCVKNGGNLDFKDAHCDEATTPGTGEFGHVLIPAESTTVQLTNDKTKNNTTEHTPFVLKGELSLAPARITCTHANGEAKIKNEEVGGVMQVKGENGGFLNLTTCTVQEPLNCTVKEPIVWQFASTTKTNINTNEMGVEFKPAAGSVFTEITYEGASCGLKGKTFKVEGSMIATGRRGSTEAVTSSGATLEFTNAMTKSTLKLGGKVAEVEGTLTLAMTNASKETENAITLTTTAN